MRALLLLSERSDWATRWSTEGSEDLEGYFEQTADDSKPYETYKCDLSAKYQK
jgi:hypothetical protein